MKCDNLGSTYPSPEYAVFGKELLRKDDARVAIKRIARRNTVIERILVANANWTTERYFRVFTCMDHVDSRVRCTFDSERIRSGYPVQIACTMNTAESQERGEWSGRRWSRRRLSPGASCRFAGVRCRSPLNHRLARSPARPLIRSVRYNYDCSSSLGERLLSLPGMYEKVDWYGLDSRCPKEATGGIDPEENLLPP